MKFGHADFFFFPQSFSTFASSLTSPSQNHIHQVLICLSLLFFHWASPSQVVLVVKNPPTSVGDIRDTVQSLGWEESSGGGHGSPPMTTHSSILAWRIPWREEPHRPQFIVSQSQTWLKLFSTHWASLALKLVEFCSCLERDLRCFLISHLQISICVFEKMSSICALNMPGVPSPQAITIIAC